MTTAEELIEELKKQNKTICSCESLTAGLFSATLAGVSGASAVLKGGLVTYSSMMKHVLAHVPLELIHTFGVISSECAGAMSENTAEIMHSDICVSFTGNAGPSAMEHKPAGLVYIGITINQKTEILEMNYTLSRNELRAQVVEDAMQAVLERLHSSSSVKNRKETD